MKKLIKYIDVVITLLLLSSCTSVKQTGEQVSTEVIDQPETTVQQEITRIEYDYASVFGKSVEEVVQKIKNVRHGEEEDVHNRLASLNKLIVPDCSIEGYELWGVEINESRVFYYYTPINFDVEMGMIDYDRDYIITVCRPEYANQEDPLKPLSEQQQIKTPLNEDGYLHVASMRDLTFTYENTWISIRYPKGKTYQDIKPLCKAKTIEID